MDPSLTTEQSIALVVVNGLVVLVGVAVGPGRALAGAGVAGVIAAAWTGSPDDTAVVLAATGLAALVGGLLGRLREIAVAQDTTPTVAATAVAQAVSDPGQRWANPDGLTPRETEVLELVALGHSNDEIAATLVVSASTVKTHINNLFAKTGVRDRAQAVRYAYDQGLVAPPTGGDRA